MDVRVGVEDPRTQDVQHVQAAHLAFARQHTPPEDVHALTPAGLSSGTLTVYGARTVDGQLLAIGALQQVEPGHAELKSMHTVASARGQGVGRTLLQHLLAAAAEVGYARVSLETGTMPAFAPARALYTAIGFVTCPPFGGYSDSPSRLCMTMRLR